MKTVAVTEPGHSRFDDRLWALLGKCEGLDDLAYPYGVDHLGLVPFMLMAGASVHTTVEDDLVSLAIQIPDGFEEEFYQRLEDHLQEAIQASVYGVYDG